MTWICGVLFPTPHEKIVTKKFCFWCHSKDCSYENYLDCKANMLLRAQRCPYHDEVMPPPYCHRCCYAFTKPNERVKPTLYKPDYDRYDKRLCLDWICEDCFRKDEERKDLDERKYNNTVEAAKLVFSQKDSVFVYENGEPVEADFPITYESLAPYVKKAIAGAQAFHYYGIEFEAIVIRDGHLYTRDDRGEYEVTWEKEDV